MILEFLQNLPQWPFAIFFTWLIVEFLIYSTKWLGRSKPYIVCSVIVLALLLPFWCPEQYPLARFIFSMITFNMIIKCTEFVYGRVHDPNSVINFFRYMIWSSNFLDIQWPQSKEEAQNNRRLGLQKLGWALLKLIPLALLLLTWQVCEWLHPYYFIKMFYLCCIAYFFFSMLGDIILGLMMQSGLYFVEFFNNPLLARSPREFWGKRWNLYFRDVCHRNVFTPLQGKTHPLIAVILVFVVSALLHEYMMFVSVGTKTIGMMSLFFGLHCFATIAQTLLSRFLGKKTIMPVWTAVPLHCLWMVLTIPLVAEPILLVIPVPGFTG